MKDVNITVGRFQPFTKGHLQMCKDGFDKNGLPVVIFLVNNKKFDSRHPFSNDLILKELEIVKKTNKFIEDIFIVTKANIVEMGEILMEHEYVAHLLLCGEDREEKYRTTQVDVKKYREWGGYPDDFTTYTGSGRVENVSGTLAREAIKNGDKKEFKRIMPDDTDKLFNEFSEEISNVNEDETQSLSDFVCEWISSGRNTKRKRTDRDEYRPTDKSDLIREIHKTISEEGYNCDLNYIDVSGLTDLSDLFYYIPDFDGDISMWDTSNLVNARNMFFSSKYTGRNGDISDWDVKKLVFGGRMFYGSKFDGDISAWELNSLNIKQSPQFLANCPLAKNRKHWPKKFR